MKTKYVQKLNDIEMDCLLEMISGNEFKKQFSKFPQRFAKIKKGFRANTLSDNEAKALVCKNKKEWSIQLYMDEVIKDWIKKIEDGIQLYKSDGKKYDEALAMALLESTFKENANLYFAITATDNIDKMQINNIKQLMEKYKNENDLAKYTKTYNIGFKDINSVIKENEALKRKNKELAAKLESLNKECLEKVIEREVHNDKTIEKIELKDGYDHMSYCEVGDIDVYGNQMLKRIADIDCYGNIEKFYFNDNMPACFENRAKLYFKNGPSEPGSAGVWGWYATENRNSSEYDYQESYYMQDVIPVEVICLYKCVNINDLITTLKNGVEINYLLGKMIFAYLANETYTGLLCNKADFLRRDNLLYLKSDIIKLPCYQLSAKDVIDIGNSRKLYKKLSLGKAKSMVRIADEMELIRSAILSHSNWKMFKEAGWTRSTWKSARNLIEKIDTSSVYEDIAVKLECSKEEAIKSYNKFVAVADKYIDGDAIEDEVSFAVISKNEKLLERCKAMLSKEWYRENEKRIEEAEINLTELQQEVDKKNKELEEKNKSLKIQKEKYDRLSNEIQKQEKLALDVEVEVSRKIENAQQNAAKFIASMSFVTSNMVQQSDMNTSKRAVYKQGTVLEKNKLEENTSWQQVLDVIADNLCEAGVISNLARPLAAYIYAAYLNNMPLLLLGPNGREISDAFSIALCGRTAGYIDLDGEYQDKLVLETVKNDDKIISIGNPFVPNWIIRLPEMVQNKNKYYIVVYPFVEDIRIEPKSIFNYMLPVFTDLLIDKDASNDYIGGCKAQEFEEFTLVDSLQKNKKLFDNFKISPYLKKRIGKVVQNMSKMVECEYNDYAVLFTLVPYAYATMQMSKLIELFKNDEEKYTNCGKNVLGKIDYLYEGEE